MFPTALPAATARWIAAAFTLALVVAVALHVDLDPRVEGEFFFADDDPQLAADRAVRELFAPGGQVILRVDAGEARDLRGRLRPLIDSLSVLPGVESVLSVVANDPSGPLYRRVLTTPDSGVTNVVLQVEPNAGGELVAGVERVVAAQSGLRIDLSGAPVVVEWIRRSLRRDLVVFTTAAGLVFALLVGLLTRDPVVVAGAVSTCLVAVSTTLLALQSGGVRIGLLTANLATIVFVLTLSHMVFMTVNVRAAALEGRDVPAPRGARDGDGLPSGGPARDALPSGGPARDGLAPSGDEAVARGVGRTFEGSFWAMSTTLLGFLSLLVASARPLRELGIAGAVGTLVAIVAAYLVFPHFLRGRAWRARGAAVEVRRAPRSAPVVLAAAAVALIGALGVLRLDTDPPLLDYFAGGSPLGAGLTQVDADGGSSALHIVVAAPGGARLDTDEAYRALADAQTALEAHSRTGVVLGPSVFIDQARTLPLAGFLPLPQLLDIASSPRLDEVALGFVTADRLRGLFTLRMREGEGTEAGPPPPREVVVRELRERVEGAGLEVVQVAGLYDLQRRLGDLIGESLAVGVGGLLLLFLIVAAVVARAGGLAARMWLCLAVVPLVVLGVFGWTGTPVDIITSPAASIALAMGVDAMIHLVVRVRRSAGSIEARWREALESVGPAVLGATLLLSAGFGIFVLSDFPPTRRFGLAVVLGTVAAAALALIVLPATVRAPASATPRAASPPGS
ncbi:MMPL family transporter [Gemmatimonadota bacterium Y43]|uniref:MMPL family transporter n=1 Tax=Gaopeijia maritima TaxID=3119007 RepID=UPI0032777B8F